MGLELSSDQTERSTSWYIFYWLSVAYLHCANMHAAGELEMEAHTSLLPVKLFMPSTAVLTQDNHLATEKKNPPSKKTPHKYSTYLQTKNLGPLSSVSTLAALSAFLSQWQRSLTKSNGMHTFPSSLPSVRSSQLPISNNARTTEGSCCEISIEWRARLEAWLAHPGQCIQTRVPTVANGVQGPLPMHISPAKQSTWGTGQRALSTTKTPHLPPLNMSVILGLGEESITVKNPLGKPPQLLCWGQLQQGGRQFQQQKAPHNPPTQRNPATQNKRKIEHGTI